MPPLYGMVTASDYARTVNDVGQQAIYDIMRDVINASNENLRRLTSVFVENPGTEVFQETYYMAGGGYLQDIGDYDEPAASKPTGSWTVAYPLRARADQKAFTDVDAGYMTVEELDALFEDTLIKNRNSLRRSLLQALFRNTPYVFKDPRKGDLTVQPLANNDTVEYPPTVGAVDPATENHYLVSGYVIADISGVNNPVKTIVRELKHHWEGNDARVAVFINGDDLVDEIKGLPNFKEVSDANVTDGSGVSRATNPPTGLPGVVIGYTDGAWIIHWESMPEGYMAGIHTGVKAPLKIRVDTAASRLPVGLQMISTDYSFPITSLYYRNRYGVGVGNRLNGVIMQVKASGSYDTPTVH